MLPKFKVASLDDIATLYTPGVACSVQEIIARPDALHELSTKDNMIGVATDGTAVLGLGRAGPRAAVPVMEGKAAMFKLLAGIDAVPLCIAVEKSLDLVDILVALEPSFGGYNIEDVASPSCDRAGILCAGKVAAPAHHVSIAAASNHERRRGGIGDAVRGADVFIGVSVAEQLSGDMVLTMQPNPIIFALANPIPEIMPEEVMAAGAAIVATGRFDYPNQCNNVLAFPALMRAAIDTRARRLDREVYLAAARTIAAEISDAALGPSSILPSPLSPTLYPNVAEATAQVIVERGLARRDPGRGSVADNTRLLRQLVAERQSVLQRRAELHKR